LFPLLADWPGAVTGEHSRQSLPYQLLVDHGVTDFDQGHGPPVAVGRDWIDLNHLCKDQVRGDVFCLGSKVLILLRAVDTPEANLLGLTVVEEGRWFASVEVNAAAGSGGSN
jgi:hypothetical protein